MLPGIIAQVSLDWKPDVNYYLPTIKRYNGKIYEWKALSGPKLGGPRPPGPGSETYWQVIDLSIDPRTKVQEEEDWDLLIMDGKYLVRSIQNVSVNPPKNITAWWWVNVSSCDLEGKLQVMQEARLHEVAEGGSAQFLSRVSNGTKWGPWHYNYTFYAG